MLFLKENGTDNELDVMAIGSSMSLNNIHSRSMVDRYGPEYLNISSWGQTIEEDYELLKIFAPRFKPKTLVISSNFMDFENNPITIKYNLLDTYVFENKPLSGFDLRYNIKNAEDYRLYLKEKNGYKYLDYDENGGINLEPKDFKIESGRWNGRQIGESSLDSKHYRYLDSISNFCRSNDISFLFVQAPFRNGFYNELKGYQIDSLQNHVNRTKAILYRYGHQYVNSLDYSWPDSLFVDYSHFNEVGAKKYTELFLGQTDKTNRY